jgi:hypothetical protein
MEFSITVAQKQMALQTARRRLESEIYLLALLSGMDPDTLELVDKKFTWQPDASMPIFVDSTQRRLRNVLDIYETLLEKL